jgi:methyltransferase family protein
MLASSSARILERLGDADLVLDVGGGGNAFKRADWVLDLLDYDGRGIYGEPPDASAERFGPDTWVQRDMCAHQPWPFADRQFDFVICSHTLEDVRDPIWVCDELTRVAKAGYIEVPSRLEEQSYGFQGPWTGWGHHRWLIDLEGDELTFVFKHHVLHNRESDRFPAGFQQSLTEEQKVISLWWEGGFGYHERVFLDAPSLDSYLADFVAANRHLAPEAPPAPTRWRGLGLRRPRGQD